MDPWCRSNITFHRMEVLVHHNLLHAWTSTMEWLLPSEEELPSSPNGYVVSFAHFHEHEFMTPTPKFLRGQLYYYKIELQHLNPNGI